MVKIRTAGIKDEDKVIALYMQLAFRQLPVSERLEKRESVRPAFREIFSNEDQGTILVAELGNDAVGIIILSYPRSVRSYACIEAFVVSEKARGEGVGGKLLEAAISESQSRGCFDIEVNNPSEQGYPLYLRYGLEDTGKHLRKYLSNSA